MSSLTRFALIAALASKGLSVKSAPSVETYATPARCQGSRASLSPILSRAERDQAARDVLAYRIARDLSTPRNPFALAIV